MNFPRIQIALITLTAFSILVLPCFVALNAQAEEGAGDQTQPTVVDPMKGLKSTAEHAGLVGKEEPKSLTQLAGNIINVLLGLLGIVAFILIIFAGFLWMISQGSKEKIDKAKGILRSSAIGLAIILASAALVNFVVFRLLDITGG